MGRTWRTSEDRILRQTVEEYDQRGEDKEEAFKFAATVIHRTERACSDRWRELYKNGRIRIKMPVQLQITDEQTNSFEQFTQMFESFKQQHVALIQENENLRNRIAELEQTETLYLEFKRIFDAAISKTSKLEVV